MTKILKKTILLLSLITITLATVTVSATAPRLSPALDIISAQNDMVKSGIKGSAVCFSEEDFSSHSMADFRSITITQLPFEEDGKLMLGSTEIMLGQTISNANLDLLRFVATGKSDSSYFCFTSDNNYTTRCTLILTEDLGSAPKASGAGILTVTQEDIACVGTLGAEDADGDVLLFEITSYPENGLVTLTDCKNGSFVYTPYEGFTGTDTFSYRVRDSYGNYSGSSKVSLRVDKRASDEILSDMEGHPSHSAALAMVSAGYMDVISENGKLYFDPDEVVTREEYLTLVMKALGACDLSPANTIFHDNNSISREYSGYVAAAYKLGIINGTEIDGLLYFNPKESVTRAEAAVILNKILGAKSSGTIETAVTDDPIPSWAIGDISALSEMGIMSVINDGKTVNESLTRGECASILYTTNNIYS